MRNIKKISDKKNSIYYIYKLTKSVELLSLSKYKKLYFEYKIYNDYYQYYFDLIHKKINFLYYEYIIPFVQIDTKIVKTLNHIYIIVTTDHGFCAHLNLDLFQYLIKYIIDNKYQNKIISLIIIGKKGKDYLILFKKKNIKYKVLYINNLDTIYGINIKRYITVYITNIFIKWNYDVTIYLVNNIFINKHHIIPNISQILPIKINLNNVNLKYIYSTKIYKYIDNLLINYINTMITYHILNNILSEYIVRIMVMHRSVQSSNNLFTLYTTLSNKFRQISVTNELLELISNLYV